MLTTPLHDHHLALGARMVPFGDWLMPVQYPEGILREYAVNRQGCSVFDCSHMGEFIIEGGAETTGLDRIVVQTLTDLPQGSCRYGAALNENGGVIDDLIVYRLAEERWMVVVNAGNIVKDAAHFRSRLRDAACFSDVSAATAKIDVQGPLSRDVLRGIFPGVERLGYYAFDRFSLQGVEAIISRTGYTGELGFEIYCPWARAALFWDAVLSDPRVRPTGLGARDVLRLEVGYPLYGHELDETITPLEAGLSRFLDPAKDFIGRPALDAQAARGVDRSLVFFVSADRRAPRQGHPLRTPDGVSIGRVASGTFSPALGRGIGSGFVKKEFTLPGKEIIFGDERSSGRAVVVARPFYRQGTLKS